MRAIAFDSVGAWIGTTVGLAYLKDTTWQVFNTGNSPLVSNNITSLHLDANNTVWAGTINGGLVRVEEKGWIVYRNSNSGIPDNSVLDIAHDSDSNLWIVTPAGGVAAYNGNTWLSFNIANSNSPTNSYNGIALSANGAKHLTTIANGFVIYNGNNDWQNYTATNSALPQDELLCIETGDSNCVWLGTLNNGLARFCEIGTPLSAPEEKSWSYTVSNPVSSEINICFANMPPSIIELNLFNLTGINKLSLKTANTTITLSLAGMANGIYFLEIKAAGKREIANVLVANAR